MGQSDKKAGTLFVSGGDSVMRRVFQERGRGYWSALFGMILNKQGWLDFETAGENILDRPDDLAGYESMILAWLPPGSWTKARLDNLRRFKGPVFLEGPFPDHVLDFLGLEPGHGPVFEEGKLIFHDPGALAVIAKSFKACFGLKPADGSFHIGPRKIGLKSKALARQELETASPDPFRAVHDLALSYLLLYRGRFERGGAIFSEQKNKSLPGLLGRFSRRRSAREEWNSLAALAWALFMDKLAPGPRRDGFKPFLRRVAQSLGPGVQAFLSRPGNPSAAELRSAIISGCALALAGQVLGQGEFIGRAELVAGLGRECAGPGSRDLGVRSWLLYLSALLARNDPSGLPGLLERLADFPLLSAADFQRHGVKSLWPAFQAVLALGTAHASAKGGIAPEKGDSGHMAGISRGLGLGPGAAVLGLRERLGLSGGLAPAAALLSPLLDPDQGLLRNARAGREGFEPEKGFCLSPWLLLGLIDLAGRFEVPDSSFDGAGYTKPQIAAWEKSPFWFAPCRVRPEAGAVEIASLASSGGRFAGIVRQGRFAAATFQLLGLIVHNHTAHPLAGAPAGLSSYFPLAFEHMFFFLFRRHLNEFSALAPQVHAWPWDGRYCLTVRHDVDRPISRERLERILDFEEKSHVRASWYWIPSRLDPARMERILENGGEIGLHAMTHAAKEEEIAAVERSVKGEIRVRGEQWHGGGGGEYWVGHPSVRAAVRSGLDYTEFLSSIYDFPYYGFPALLPDGLVGLEPIFGSAKFFSVDSIAGWTEKDRELVRLWLLEMAENNFHIVLLNHPDDHLDELAHWVGILPRQGRVDFDFAGLSQWWSRTRSGSDLRPRLVFRAPGLRRYLVSSASGVNDLELRFPLDPAGLEKIESNGREIEWRAGRDMFSELVRVRLDLDPGREIRLDLILREGSDG